MPRVGSSRQSIQRLKIKTSSPDLAIGRLSGGNQQKAILARCLLLFNAARVMFLPTAITGTMPSFLRSSGTMAMPWAIACWQTSSPDLAIGRLSGGNQQKAILARCLLLNPRILILDEPSSRLLAGPVNWFNAARVMFLPTAITGTMPSFLRSSGTMAMPWVKSLASPG
jgi:ABC-type transporter Mla maintaining outer membrane lipid asymmetry ATPase subunit MlaF